MTVMADHPRGDDLVCYVENEHRGCGTAEGEIEVGARIVPRPRQAAGLPKRDDSIAIFRLGNRTDKVVRRSAHTRIGIST